MNKHLRLIELFAGYGSQALALDYLNLHYESWFVCDFDKYAIQSYNDIHNTNYVPTDITKINANDLNIIDTNNYDYILTYSFPCTDLSVAGKQAGMQKGSNTRSGLLWEVERLLKECKELPQYLLMENVPQVIGKKNIHDFKSWCQFLTELGYTNSYKLLNAKDYGIPQNRERCFMVSILNGKKFKFPDKQPLELRLKDMLEDNVDTKYYLSEKVLKHFVLGKHQSNTVYSENGLARTLCSGDYKSPLMIIGTLDIKGQDNIKRIYSQKGISPTLTSMQGGNRQPKILENNIAQKVKVRKYSVDTKRLKTLLKENKTISCKEIATLLNKPLTTVEHWFRNDDSFAIPDEDVWFQLKKLLNITTDEFDKSITTFEIKDGVYEKANRVYLEDGIAPTLTQQQEKIIEINKNAKHQQDLVQSEDDICRTIPAGTHGSTPHLLKTVVSDKRLQKLVDNTDFEEGKVLNLDTYNQTTNENISQCLTEPNHNNQRLFDGYRIRKLTPKECLRLMGVQDKEINKFTVSDSQKYKQARK